MDLWLNWKKYTELHIYIVKLYIINYICIYIYIHLYKYTYISRLYICLCCMRQPENRRNFLFSIMLVHIGIMKCQKNILTNTLWFCSYIHWLRQHFPSTLHERGTPVWNKFGKPCKLPPPSLGGSQFTSAY